MTNTFKNHAGKSTIGDLIDRGELASLIVKGGLLTLVVNAASLVSPLFFTQIYDRVLVTGNLSTLAVLAVGAICIILTGAMFEQIRSVVFTRLGASLYIDLEPHVYRASEASALRSGVGRRSLPLDDLETVRSGIAGPLPGAFLDFIFAPFYLAVLYLIHSWIGHFALGVLVVVGFLSFITQWMISGSQQKSSDVARGASSFAESHLRAAEATTAMGYGNRVRDRWAEQNRSAVRTQIVSASNAGGMTALVRGVRSSGQTLIIAIAALLALQNGVSGGAIIASSIILARLLSPLDTLLGSWRQVAGVRIAAKRLGELLQDQQAASGAMIAKPQGRLEVDGLYASANEGQPLLRGISFSVEPGEIIAIVGPTGAGKSTLLRAILGVWPSTSGGVRLDGTPLLTADREQIGPHIGFLPQNGDLAPGTIADNISRFDPSNAEAIVAAARAAGAEPLIASLANGYETEVGDLGAALSAGQRRRIALARAMYGCPSLVCLDEPEANLDRDGEMALAHALSELKAAGSSVLIAAHKPSILQHTDKVLIMKDGRLVQFGPTDEVIAPVATGASKQRVST